MKNLIKQLINYLFLTVKQTLDYHRIKPHLKLAIMRDCHPEGDLTRTQPVYIVVPNRFPNNVEAITYYGQKNGQSAEYRPDELCAVHRNEYFITTASTKNKSLPSLPKSRPRLHLANAKFLKTPTSTFRKNAHRWNPRSHGGIFLTNPSMVSRTCSRSEPVILHATSPTLHATNPMNSTNQT